MRKLFLDDFRNPPDFTWDVVRSYTAFIEYILKNGVPDLISFDHDLGEEHYPKTEEDLLAEIDYSKYTEKTGYDCAKWLAERGVLPGEYIVHSLNPVGRKNIEFVMQSAYRRHREEL
jgi:hypothetical protein